MKVLGIKDLNEGEYYMLLFYCLLHVEFLKSSYTLYLSTTNKEDNTSAAPITQPAEGGPVDAATVLHNAPSATMTQDGGNVINITPTKTGGPVDTTMDDNNFRTFTITQGPYSQSRFI